MKIDLNCDLGENSGNDEAIMPYVTSVNIACGFHAGDANVMRATVRLAKKYNVNIGAHPSWFDLEGFGRREMNLPMEEVESLIAYQIGALAAIAQAEGVALTHVKPHGALYNQAAKDIELASAIARAVKKFDSGLILVGLAGSKLRAAGSAAGIQTAAEGFPDRAYNPDGTLMPRGNAGAVIEAPAEVAANALKLIQKISVDTLCLHGDNAHAAENAKLLRKILTENGIEVTGLR